MVRVEFYDGTGNDDEARDGAEPIAEALLEHVPRKGDAVWLKPLGWYRVKDVEYEIDTVRNETTKVVSIWLRPDKNGPNVIVG